MAASIATACILLLLAASAACVATGRRARDARPQLVFAPELHFVGRPPAGPLVRRHGERAVLTCTAGGIPPPRVSWLFNGKALPQAHELAAPPVRLARGGQRKSVRNAVVVNKLTLPCLTADMSGSYACVAVAGGKRIVAHTHIVVGEANGSLPPCESPTLLGADSPPSIYTWTSGRFEMAGNAAQLHCRAGGTPAPTVDWFKADNMDLALADDHRYVVRVNGDLIIKDTADYSATGLYLCIANNEYGSDTAESFLYITAPEKRR